MNEATLPKGESVPPEGEPEDGQEGEEAAEAEAAELDEQARREAEDEDELLAAKQTYVRAVLEHFGPDAPVYPCPTCEANGYVLAGLSPDPDVHRCSTCHGLGVTSTGSLVEGRQTRECPACRGAGFVEEFAVPVAEPAPPTVQGWEPLPASAFEALASEPLPLGEAV